MMMTRHRNGFRSAGVLICALFSFTLFASAGTYSGGSGTAEDPYKISTVADWQELITASADWNKHFVLLNDIDFGGINLTPVAPDTNPNNEDFDGTAFSGRFNGNGHVLRNAIISMPDSDFVGLFGRLGFVAEIRNLGTEDIAVTGNEWVGGLCGHNLGGKLFNDYTTGDVGGFESVGGLCGINENIISGCYATGHVSGSDGVGGLCGYNYSGAILECTASGTVTGQWGLGGLCGANEGTIRNCYAAGEVDGVDSIGGLVGATVGGTITYCYSRGKVGYSSASGGCIGACVYTPITACFWDTQTSEQSDSAGGIGLTTAEMKALATFTSAGWDFVGEEVNGTADIWRMGADGADYPRLAWEGNQTNPCVTLSSKHFVFVVDQAGVNPGSKSLTLTKTCDGPHDWVIEVDDSCDWLSVDPVFGDFNPPFNKTYLSIDTSGLVQGQYFGTVFVTIRDGNTETTQTVDIELNVGVDQPSPYGGGTGTAEDPYQIRTAEQMNAIGAHPKDWDQHFALMADLDMSSYTDWDLNLIGTERYMTIWQAFDGTFDGRGHTLSGLTIMNRDCFVLGLFRGIGENGVVKNLGLISPTVAAEIDCGGGIVGSNVGILAGTVAPGGRIENCWIQDGSVEGGDGVGCLVGSNSGTIRNCRVSGSVNGKFGTGGLAGINSYEVMNSYSECSVNGTRSVGGLVGHNGSVIFHCYSTGTVDGDEDFGGLVGFSEPSEFVEGSFWDIDTSGINTSAGGSGLTTELMKNRSYFVDWARWDFTEESTNGTEDIWRM